MLGFVRKICCSVFVASCLVCLDSFADLTIDITRGIFAPTPIGIIGFYGDEYADEIAKVVKNDLANSGAFDVLKSSGTRSPEDFLASPSFWEWSYKKGCFVVCGALRQNDGTEAVLRLYNVALQKYTEFSVRAPRSVPRVLAHKISDVIYKAITGEDGYFNTKIVYTAQYGSATKKKHIIAIMDQDGANGKALTNSANTSVSPRFSPIKNQIAFVSFKGNSSKVHVMDLSTQDTFTLPSRGTVISPCFSHDGRRIVFCMAVDGTTSIYSYDLYSKGLARMTSYPGKIDVSPSFSPDGRTMVFTSDRSGSPKIYKSGVYGGSAEMISRGRGNYYAPSISPDGRMVAFVKREGGCYYVGIMNIDGSGERMIARDHVVDSPRWCPNSRAVVFASQGRLYGPFSIYIAAISGRALRKVPTILNGVQYEGCDPSWSPNLAVDSL
ncbi:hypothetical protein [Candidatus Hydrogenosomobacter endosymbioticus]|uniref:Protein TolB n=1 Tax=Candidatus Hydrogenosomobacter endosymbioticus TaxID=2558174 RepID=A0ABM7V8Y8_9PROT|nr:hypothetical protein [Candidatus Hydrogenosomobacter endosymbioticus]BDB96261.1 protein TolB [Candidatus Hydrogenosomobacter endosymbioticus]